MASHQQRMRMLQQQQQQQQRHQNQSRPSHGSQQSYGHQQQQQQEQYQPHPQQQQYQQQYHQQYQQQSQPRYQQNPQQPSYQPQTRTTPNASIQSYPNSNSASQSGSLQQGGYRPAQPLSSSNPVLYQHQQPNQQRHPSGHSGYNSRPGSMGARSYHGSRTSMGSHGQRQGSRSLGASKASLATYRSGKSSIQQEYHDRLVHSRLSAIHLGKARTPFLIAIFLFVAGFIIFIIGIVITVLRWQGVIYFAVDSVDAIGPIILVLGLVLCAIGIKFIYDAYKISESERRRFRFRAGGESSVSVNTVTSRVPDPGEVLASGTSTQNAITRTPVGSRTTLSAV